MSSIRHELDFERPYCYPVIFHFPDSKLVASALILKDEGLLYRCRQGMGYEIWVRSQEL